MFKSICFVLVSLVSISICSADPVTITSAFYTVTGFANLPTMPTSYSLTDSSPVSSSTSVIDQAIFSAGSADSSAGGLSLQTDAVATGFATAGATASTLITFHAPSDLLVVDASFGFYIGDFGSISGSYTVTDLNTSATIGTRTFNSTAGIPKFLTQSATDDFLIDHTHAYSLSMSLSDSHVGEVGDSGRFSLALNPPPVPLPSALPMGLVLAALIGLGVGTRREGKGAGAR